MGFTLSSACLCSTKFGGIVEQVDRGLHEEYQNTTRGRIALGDSDDWPVVATARLLDLPIWTEDQDFFGSGGATLTSDRVELYLQGC